MTEDQWAPIRAAVMEYGNFFADAAMHRAASKRDIAHASALSALQGVRRAVEALAAPPTAAAGERDFTLMRFPELYGATPTLKTAELTEAMQRAEDDFYDVKRFYEPAAAPIQAQAAVAAPDMVMVKREIVEWLNASPMSRPAAPLQVAQQPPLTDAQIDALARQWSNGAPMVLCYDVEGRPIDGWEFSMVRFRFAIRAAMSMPAPKSDALTPPVDQVGGKST